MTGYWKNRGFFIVFLQGKRIGSAPTPEQAQAMLDAAQAA